VYPYIVGWNGYERKLSDCHWIELGAVLQKIHTQPLSEKLTTKLQRETWTPKWRRMAESYLDMAEKAAFDDPIASALAEFLKEEGPQIIDLIQKADLLASELHSKPLDFVLCHSDIHAGNVLIDSHDRLYIIDWDEPILAPKERDLMYAGGRQFLDHRTPQEEERLFYAGYGQVQVDAQVLAYYRYERIIADIAIFCEQIFDKKSPDEDRIQGLRFLKSNFLPNGTIEVAVNAERTITQERK
jgi:spectinomycin phosphotransferase